MEVQKKMDSAKKNMKHIHTEKKGRSWKIGIPKKQGQSSDTM